MVENNSVVVEVKNKVFRKSLKKMLKELDKLPLDDQAKMVKMLASYCSMRANYDLWACLAGDYNNKNTKEIKDEWSRRKDKNWRANKAFWWNFHRHIKNITKTRKKRPNQDDNAPYG